MNSSLLPIFLVSFTLAGLQSLQQLGGTPLSNGPLRPLVVPHGIQTFHSLLDAFQFGQGCGLPIEYIIHILNQLIDGEVDDGEVVQEPGALGSRLLYLEQSRQHVGVPLVQFEFAQLLGGLLLAVDRDDVAHVLDRPDVHVHDRTVLEGTAQQLPVPEPVDHVHAHGHGFGDDEAALAQVGQAGEGPLLRALRAEPLPLGQREQSVLIVHSQVLAQQSAHLRLALEVVVADHDLTAPWVVGIGARLRGLEPQTALHFRLGFQQRVAITEQQQKALKLQGKSNHSNSLRNITSTKSPLPRSNSTAILAMASSMIYSVTRSNIEVQSFLYYWKLLVRRRKRSFFSSSYSVIQGQRPVSRHLRYSYRVVLGGF